MGIDAAIGAIDHIYQLQQQVQSPAALLASQGTSSSGGASLTGASGQSTAGQATSFAAELANAQGLSSAIGSDTSSTDSTGLAASSTGSSGLSSTGLTASDLLAAAGYGSAASGVAGSTPTGSALTGTGLTSAGVAGAGLTTSLSGGVTSLAGGASVGSATSAADPRITAMVDQANSLIGKPYVWGGGHSGWGPQTGYDCSGFVSAVLHAGGYLSSPQDTQTLPSQPGIESGPGQYVTIYDRTDAGSSDHVIIDIGGQFYESGGEHSTWGGGGGVAKIGTPSPSYLATFNQVLHPAGL